MGRRTPISRHGEPAARLPGRRGPGGEAAHSLTKKAHHGQMRATARTVSTTLHRAARVTGAHSAPPTAAERPLTRAKRCSTAARFGRGWRESYRWGDGLIHHVSG